MSEESFKEGIVAAIPSLRAFARSLSGNRDRADDLVQETLAKAIANRERYTPGTNLKAWMITILRNQYYTEGRKRKREVPDSDGDHAATLTALPQQNGHLEMNDFLSALQCLPEDQREALILIGASGFSYEEAAEMLETRVGTVKSRVSRARSRLDELMSGSPDFKRDSASIEASRELLQRALGV
ncbi:sigma-70 family RNA polymerase sigma factor [Roseibium limicola]|uniref:Sigma-70 family RNA polymerase sigma factor n=1 Tax=Roseibium limicola TaxID=2816037 RepID=A0A939ERV7_9HYPH|nr:sigma-70 family RNA polymerase sigma factor [Roseibium limicola]MBO0347353.1 sigma-70 family RNA polymerase sigma factor [Roseibium limicola]